MSTAAPSPPKRRTAVPHHRGEILRLPRHPSAPEPSDLAGVRRWLRGVRAPTAVDLFCGAGGLSFGLVQAGFSVLVGADSDAWAVETHTANVGGLGYAGDLSDPTDFIEHLDGWGLATVDLVVGGVPCQPFSNAGRSKTEGAGQGGRSQPRRPARPALAELHGRRRAPETAGRVDRERPGPALLG